MAGAEAEGGTGLPVAVAFRRRPLPSARRRVVTESGLDVTEEFDRGAARWPLSRQGIRFAPC